MYIKCKFVTNENISPKRRKIPDTNYYIIKVKLNENKMYCLTGSAQMNCEEFVRTYEMFIFY